MSVVQGKGDLVHCAEVSLPELSLGLDDRFHLVDTINFQLC